MADKDQKPDATKQTNVPDPASGSSGDTTSDQAKTDAFVGLVLDINGRTVTLGPRTMSSLEQNGYVFHLDEEVPLGKLGESSVVSTVSGWLGNIPGASGILDTLKDADIKLSELYIRMPPQDGKTVRKESYLAKFYGGWKDPQTLVGTIKIKGVIFGGTNMSADDLTRYLPHAMSAPLLAPAQPQKALPAAKGNEASQPGDGSGGKKSSGSN